jgi:hypothetical protein
MKTKFAIGCLTQWYEADIIYEYIDSLVDAINEYDGEVLVDFVITKNHEQHEHFNGTPKDMEKCLDDIKNKINKLRATITVVPGLHSISEYRQKFNTDFCEKADVLVWGEPDMLMPKQAFTILDHLHKQVDNSTPKYLATFATSKMWDKTWESLEHIDFTNKEFDGESDKHWWSLKYTMSKEEMNKFNDKVEDLEVTLISPHKFQGCGLVISSEVIKSGVNIPKSVFFVHEDTAFMHMTNKILGDIPQYHFKNILMVHNRKHPKKMSNVMGKGNFNKYDVGKLRNQNEWYKKAHEMSLQNSNNIFNPNYKSFTWKDVWK